MRQCLFRVKTYMKNTLHLTGCLGGTEYRGGGSVNCFREREREAPAETLSDVFFRLYIFSNTHFTCKPNTQPFFGIFHNTTKQLKIFSPEKILHLENILH